MQAFNINTAGFVIVGLFALTWIVALLVWRIGKVEEKWDLGAAQARSTSATETEPELAVAGVGDR
jgi:high-affinity nickel-transport protein